MSAGGALLAGGALTGVGGALPAGGAFTGAGQQLTGTGTGKDKATGGGAGACGVVHGHGATPGGGGAPRAFDSTVCKEIAGARAAGIAFAGNPDLAVVPTKEPLGREDCIASTKKRRKQAQSDAEQVRLTGRNSYGCL
jgi:hypothetical protein